MVLDILSLTYLLLEDVSLIFNILLFYVLLKHWQKAKNLSFVFLLSFSGIDIIISIIRIFSYSINLRTMSIGGSETLTISILSFLSSGFFLLFIDYFENKEISPFRLSFFTGLVGFFIAGRIVFRLHNEVRSLTIALVGTELYYSVYTFISMVPIFFNVTNFVVSYLVLRRCIEKLDDSTHEAQFKMLQLAAFFLYMFSYIFITIGNFLWDLGFMNELVNLLNNIIPIISNIVGIIVLWYIFSKDDLIEYWNEKIS
ncbi:MAG: hypothetical protein EU541_06895 [Promethearchaeota archaeon]|nr:MAG: hypothetical protein EU541_06895 [Candidatus Lokiarchaeota archaeon]